MNNRKLLFSLKNGFKIQLAFSDHYGTNHLVSSEKSDVLKIREDDEKTKEELLDYYDARYARFGLDTKFQGDNKVKEEVKPDPVISEEPVSIDVHEDTSDVPESTPEVPEDVTEDKYLEKEVEDVKEAPEHFEESEKVDLVEKYTEDALEKLPFKQLSAMCKEQNLTVDVRSKDACIKAILKAQGE